VLYLSAMFQLLILASLRLASAPCSLWAASPALAYSAGVAKRCFARIPSVTGRSPRSPIAAQSAQLSYGRKTCNTSGIAGDANNTRVGRPRPQIRGAGGVSGGCGGGEKKPGRARAMSFPQFAFCCFRDSNRFAVRNNGFIFSRVCAVLRYRMFQSVNGFTLFLVHRGRPGIAGAV